MDEYEPIAKIWISGRPPAIRMRCRLAWGEALEYCQIFDTAERARRHMQAFASAEQINTDDWHSIYNRPLRQKLPETDVSYTKNASGKYEVPSTVGVEYHGVSEAHLEIDIPNPPPYDDGRVELAEHFPRISNRIVRPYRPSRMDMAHLEWRLRHGWLI